MSITKVFQRFEVKFLLDKSQYNKLIKVLEGHNVNVDQYGKTLIQSIYYDNDSKLLIRRSAESPIYKEKFRLRCYWNDEKNKKVFAEIKKKFNGCVYKRRTTLEFDQYKDLYNNLSNKQIDKEIKYLLDFYKDIKPAVLILYDRISYTDGKIRITFDENIRFREKNLEFSDDISGIKILDDDKVLMEIKTLDSIPLWLAKALSELKIYKTSYSKYKTAFELMIKKSEETK